MKVEIELMAHFQKYAPAGDVVFQIEIDKGATVATVLDKLGIPASEKRLTIVSGRPSTDNQALIENDTIAFLPAVEGG